MSDPELATALDIARCLALHAVECERERVREARGPRNDRVGMIPDLGPKGQRLKLTPRQAQIVALKRTLTNSQIAAQLGISTACVGIHLSNARYRAALG